MCGGSRWGLGVVRTMRVTEAYEELSRWMTLDVGVLAVWQVKASANGCDQPQRDCLRGKAQQPQRKHDYG